MPCYFILPYIIVQNLQNFLNQNLGVKMLFNSQKLKICSKNDISKYNVVKEQGCLNG